MCEEELSRLTSYNIDTVLNCDKQMLYYLTFLLIWKFNMQMKTI